MGRESLAKVLSTRDFNGNGMWLTKKSSSETPRNGIHWIQYSKLVKVVHKKLMN